MTANKTQAAADRQFRQWCKFRETRSYLAANGYLDANSIAMACQDIGITVDQWHEWALEAELDAAEAYASNRGQW